MTRDPRCVSVNGRRVLQFCLCLSMSVACSGRVDLGASATAKSPDPISNSVEMDAKTTNLVRLDTYYVGSLAVDDTYLYLASTSAQDPSSYYLQRCNKSDCLNTLATLRSAGTAHEGVRLYAGLLGWNGDQGFQLCHAPNCADPNVVEGMVTEPGQNLMPAVWDDEVILWPMPQDRAIYGCEVPHCSSGPKLVASQTSATDLTLADQDLYWIESGRSLLRTAKNGGQPTERLTLGQQVTWEPFIPQIPDSAVCDARHLEVDGPWVYATMSARTSGDCGSPCQACDSGIDLARWRRDEVGGESEWLMVDDANFDRADFIRGFDREVVWGGYNGNRWSCLAEDCAATKRQFGVNGFRDASRRGLSYFPVADDRFIYWLSTPSVDNLGAQLQLRTWNLKRTPRLGR